MKTFNKIAIALGVAATTIGMSSCVNDLDLSPINPNEITDVSKDMDRVFADVYLNFATFGPNGDTPVKDFDGGKAVFQRAIYTLEEFPTDEGCWLWDPGQFGTINYGITVPGIDAVFGAYGRLIVNISLCNDFIQSVNSGKFDDSDSARAQEYVRQARILRGACYYYMLSFYSNPPYADETTPIGAEPTQPGRAEVYRLVTTDLEDVVSYYKANPTDTYYGFVGLDAAEAILAKIYLNAEVFSGTAAYDKCYAHSKAIIDRLGHGGYYNNGLARSYLALFGANNAQYAIGGSNPANEIIWTIPAYKTSNEEKLTGWGGSTFLVFAWLGTNGVSATVGYPTMDAKYKDAKGEELCWMDGEKKRVYVYCADQAAYDTAMAAYEANKDSFETVVSEVVNEVAYSFDPKATGYINADWYNSGDGWKCMVARKSFVRKFEWLDVEMSKSNDKRVALWQTSKHGFTPENPSLVGNDWGKNGYIAAKYSNWAYNEDGTVNFDEIVPKSTPLGGDYAAIRLAEVYLMAAEAILQGGGGSQAEALKYVNYIRQRAFADDPAKTDDDTWKWSSVSMQELRDERCRELYSENVRRTDLIRWNQWCTGYTWEWKGGIKSGTNLPEYTKSYPIPTRVITSSSLQQMPGY